MTSQEDKVKEYHAMRDAQDQSDEAHYVFEKYMYKIGMAGREHKQTALNQAEHDFCRSGGAVTVDYLNKFVDRCIDIAKRTPEGAVKCYAHGFRSDDECSTYMWRAFLIKDLPSDIDLTDDDLAYHLTGWVRREPVCAGQSFSSEPYYTMSRTRILVKQFRGLDI